MHASAVLDRFVYGSKNHVAYRAGPLLSVGAEYRRRRHGRGRGRPHRSVRQHSTDTTEQGRPQRLGDACAVVKHVIISTFIILQPVCTNIHSHPIGRSCLVLDLGRR